MKRLMLIGAAVCAIAVMPALPASAMPFGSHNPAVTQVDSDIVLVRRGGRGHHYGWWLGRGHHHNEGWSRGRHRGWH